MKMKFPIPTRDGITEAELTRPDSEAAVMAHDLAKNGKDGSALRILVQESCPSLESPSLVPWRTAEMIAVDAWNIGKTDVCTAVVGFCPVCPDKTITKLDRLEENGTVIYDHRVRLADLKRRGWAVPGDPPQPAATYEECNFTHTLRCPVELREQGETVGTVKSYVVRHPLLGDILELENSGGGKGDARISASLIRKCLVDADGTLRPELLSKSGSLFKYLESAHPHKLGVFPDQEDLQDIGDAILVPGLQNSIMMACRVCGHEYDTVIPTHNFFSQGQGTSSSRSKTRADAFAGRTFEM